MCWSVILCGLWEFGSGFLGEQLQVGAAGDDCEVGSGPVDLGLVRRGGLRWMGSARGRIQCRGSSTPKVATSSGGVIEECRTVGEERFSVEARFE